MSQKLPAEQRVKASKTRIPQAKHVFSGVAGSGMWQRGTHGMGVSGLQPLGLFWAYIIAS